MSDYKLISPLRPFIQFEEPKVIENLQEEDIKKQKSNSDYIRCIFVEYLQTYNLAGEYFEQFEKLKDHKARLASLADFQRKEIDNIKAEANEKITKAKSKREDSKQKYKRKIQELKNEIKQLERNSESLDCKKCINYQIELDEKQRQIHTAGKDNRQLYETTVELKAQVEDLTRRLDTDLDIGINNNKGIDQNTGPNQQQGSDSESGSSSAKLNAKLKYEKYDRNILQNDAKDFDERGAENFIMKRKSELLLFDITPAIFVAYLINAFTYGNQSIHNGLKTLHDNKGDDITFDDIFSFLRTQDNQVVREANAETAILECKLDLKKFSNINHYISTILSNHEAYDKKSATEKVKLLLKPFDQKFKMDYHRRFFYENANKENEKMNHWTSKLSDLVNETISVRTILYDNNQSNSNNNHNNNNFGANGNKSSFKKHQKNNNNNNNNHSQVTKESSSTSDVIDLRNTENKPNQYSGNKANNNYKGDRSKGSNGRPSANSN